MRGIAAVTVVAGLLLGCTSAGPGTTDDAKPSEVEPLPAHKAAADEPPTDPAPPQVEAGPTTDPAATKEQRTQAVLALLSGSGDADKLPLRDVDPGYQFDPYLADTLAPRGSRRIPRVRQGKPKVKGDLDKDIIRRIARAHINEVRRCYDLGLVENDELEGRVVIAYTIAESGKVSIAKVEESTLEEDEKGVANCVAKTVKRWKFPKPGDKKPVAAESSFVLTPG